MTAIEIIDNGNDIAALEQRGLDAAATRHRRRVLAELWERLRRATMPARPRRVMTKPEPLIMDVGDCFSYPTARGQCLNPYFTAKARKSGCTQDGWAAMVVIDRGRAFDYLAWYRPLTTLADLRRKPDMRQLQGECAWVFRWPGTCPAAHLKRMELEKIGTCTIDPAKLTRAFPSLPPGILQAISGISIANELNVHVDREGAASTTLPRTFGDEANHPIITRLTEILAD